MTHETQDDHVHVHELPELTDAQSGDHHIIGRGSMLYRRRVADDPTALQVNSLNSQMAVQTNELNQAEADIATLQSQMSNVEAEVAALENATGTEEPAVPSLYTDVSPTGVDAIIERPHSERLTVNFSGNTQGVIELPLTLNSGVVVGNAFLLLPDISGNLVSHSTEILVNSSTNKVSINVHSAESGMVKLELWSS